MHLKQVKNIFSVTHIYKPLHSYSVTYLPHVEFVLHYWYRGYIRYVAVDICISSEVMKFPGQAVVLCGHTARYCRNQTAVIKWYG